MRRRRVLIVDDLLTICAMIETLLTKQRDMEVVGVIERPEEAMAAVSRLEPDVLTLDLAMPGLDGLSLLATLMRRRPMPVVILSSAIVQDAEIAKQAIALGASACFDKSRLIANADRFVSIVRTARCGKVKVAAA